MRNKILLVEDDPTFAKKIKQIFTKELLNVVVAPDAETALEFFTQSGADLILSDVMLPGMSGVGLIKEIRKLDSEIPIILMTGSSKEETAQIEGIRTGAIDYLLKPFSFQLALEKIKQLLKINEQIVRKVGSHIISLERQIVEIDEQMFSLTEKESQVFSILLKNAGKPVERAVLLKKIWFDDDVKYNSALTKIILQLRTKLNLFPDLKIETEYGVSYTLMERK